MASSNNEFPMELRVLLAFALSAIVLLLWVPLQHRFFPPPPAQRPAAVQTSASAPAPPAAPPAPVSQKAPQKAARKPARAKKAPEAAPLMEAGQETETVVENDLYRVVFSNRGAVVKSWTLKRYRDAAGRPLELVNAKAGATLGYPFTDWVDDRALRDQLGKALFQVRASGTKAPATVVFQYNDGTLSARKEFRFAHDDHVAEVSSELANAGAPLPHQLVWRGSFGDQTVSASYQTAAVVTATPAKVDRHPYKDIKSDTRLGGPFVYAGIEDMFFAAVFMPPGQPASADPAIASVTAFHSDFQPEGEQSPIPLIGVGVGGQADNRLRVFVGPKALDVLAHVYPEPGGAERARQGQPVMTLSDLLDYGWFFFIAKPLFLALQWIHERVVANWGWAIVLLTVAINMVLFPLKLKGMKSALKMQRIAPQVKTIQEKYKKYKFNDPRKQEQNKEIMELYRKHGVNPVGGCFPMLIQIPFLYAFYKVLSISIEMRHAPWFGWIRDLSAQDPYYILPVVMMLTMFILQKMTPQTTTDPAQQKMFLLMPLVFGVMFMKVSSGLVLYWLVGNVVGIAQQWYINRAGLSTAPPGKPALATK
jgi:YidC/Oxa1 family membrane protein insertase